MCKERFRFGCSQAENFLFSTRNVISGFNLSVILVLLYVIHAYFSYSREKKCFEIKPGGTANTTGFLGLFSYGTTLESSSVLISAFMDSIHMRKPASLNQVSSIQNIAE